MSRVGGGGEGRVGSHFWKGEAREGREAPGGHSPVDRTLSPLFSPVRLGDELPRLQLKQGVDRVAHRLSHPTADEQSAPG